MTIYESLGILAGIFGVAAYIPYVVGTISKKITPHPFSWLLWSILGFVSFITYYAVGARETLPLALVSFLGPVAILLLSLKSFKGTFKRFDYICLGFSIVAIIFYVIFRHAAVALTINLVGDFLAGLPSISKTYKNPSSENAWTWGIFTLSAVLSLLAIRVWTYGIAIFPIYLFFFEGTMAILSLRGRLKKT